MFYIKKIDSMTRHIFKYTKTNMSCPTARLDSGKMIDLCTNPKCSNNHLSIRRTIEVVSPVYKTKEGELEILKRDLLWYNLNIKYYKTKLEACEKRIRELES